MDLIEVDPNLFVTCRLCLEELGQYQIVPSVRKQIKYCFDIDVAAFDGLPQLVCVKCKQILINFFAIKSTLCEKQAKLKKHIRNGNKIEEEEEVGIQPQQDTVSSSQHIAETISKTKCRARVKRVIDSSDSDTPNNTAQSENKKKIQKKKWDAKGYSKYYSCCICKSDWSTLRALIFHTRTHSNIINSYPGIFKKKCLVVLNKIDDKPNLTGSNNYIVHNNNKVTEICSSLYHVRYEKQTNDCTKSSYNPFKSLLESDSTDTEQEIVASTSQKRRRLLSKSSNDTVVIESNKVVSDNENDIKIPTQVDENAQCTLETSYQCINIVDSSDSDDDKSPAVSSSKGKLPLEAQLGDYKVIQGIISMCVSAYHKKSDTVEKPGKQASTESQLKHKVLSIGRKVINRHGVNLIGLLRYLEHRNLSIVWVTKTVTNSNSKEANYMRIMTKLRGDESVDDNYGWVPVVQPVSKVEPDSSLCRQIPHVMQDFTNLPAQNQNTTVLILCNPSDCGNKLLNANPVANPKQMPKKIGQGNEIKLNKVTSEPCKQLPITEANTVMPIITSTKSLAETITVQHTSTDKTPTETTPVIEKHAPRIKVKPVAELMSERTLLSLRSDQPMPISNNIVFKPNENTEVTSSIENSNQFRLSAMDNININSGVLSQNVWPVQTQVPNMFNIPIQLVPVACLNVVPTSSIQTTTINSPTTSKTVNNKEEYVLMNTVELPNTKTDSPFQYFKDLLKIYKITLLDPLETLPREFICLIKFQVQFKQEPINEPVVLCLSFFCLLNKFCVTVKDKNQVSINISKISPNWQWEILNVFRGDVVSKLLQNAQKQSQETYYFTNQFLCLLKSIQLTKLSK